MSKTAIFASFFISRLLEILIFAYEYYNIKKTIT